MCYTVFQRPEFTVDGQTQLDVVRKSDNKFDVKCNKYSEGIIMMKILSTSAINNGEFSESFKCTPC